MRVFFAPTFGSNITYRGRLQELGEIAKHTLNEGKHMSYRIGSWNIQRRHVPVGEDRSTRSEEPHTRDFFDILCKVIRDEKLQIIALQEVRSEWEFGSIKKNLPLGWTGHYEFDTLAPGNHGRYGFAFLWNAIEINECSKSDPVLFRNNADPKLSRDPKYGRFISVLNPLCEYRLIDIHLNSSDPTQKRHEWSFIGKKIYNRIQVDRTNSNFEGAYTFILGDFNYSVSECKQYAALDGFANINTIMEELTHINTSAIDGKCYYNSSLDHFAYDIKKCSSIVSGAWRVNAVKKYFKNDFELYMKKVSDHVPIVIEIY